MNRRAIDSAISSMILTSALVMTLVSKTGATPISGREGRAPQLPSPACDLLQVSDGNVVVFHVYAQGVQIYRWNGTQWAFVAPDAKLYADGSYQGLVGTHFAGPTWMSNSGSKVVGARLQGCTPDASAIPWLLLGAVSSQGPGVLNGVTFIQRVNTTGGLAPSAPGTTTGEEARVPYTAEYYFYRPQD